MPAFTTSVLIGLLLLAGSCSKSSPGRAQVNTAPPNGGVQKGRWSIELKTSGGFIGIGKGNLTVDSQGKCVYSITNPEKVRSGVSGTLNPRQMQPISDAVAKLNLKGWNIPGLNVAAPDAFGYKLEFRTGPDLNEVTPIQWYDNTADQLPEDLKRLNTLLEETMRNRCGGQP
jgi:hypothetical protein